MEMRHLYDCFSRLSREAKELCFTSEVPILDEPPSPLEFYRDYVSSNKPFIMRNATRDWPDVKEWSPDYLRQKVGSKEVTVAITPNGYADAVYKDYFVMPYETKMTFSRFLDILFSNSNEVHYVQKQNSNLTDEFEDLLSDVGKDVSWATEAFGKSPDAVNFWMGDGRAVTSMHKDHYENIYFVMFGHKEFILHPPTDLPWIPHEMYQTARFRRNREEENGKLDLEVISEDDKVPWIPLDPLNPDYEMYPNYKKANPIKCRVNAGEALYLPSLWFHHVVQSHACIAVNYWYDMEYDWKYAYYKFVESLISKVNSTGE